MGRTGFRTVAYVAETMEGSRGFHVGLLHLELPPRMLEWGGAEDPEIEDKVETERDEIYRQLEKDKLAKGKSLLQRLQVLVADKGIDVTGLYLRFEEPLDRKSVASAILNAAREGNFGIVVVGRHGCTG